MNPGIDARRWSEIRAAFDELVELDPAQRSEQLAAIGSTDPDLRSRVEALLSADSTPTSGLTRIEALFGAPARDGFDRDPLGLTGRHVSHFLVGEAIAAGGMGVVYRAEDTSLHRTIALKFPLPAMGLHRNVKERFVREARSAAALDHPNICSIHEFGELEDGRLFLAMPLYEGETLKSRLAHEGALPLAEAISIARQITEGVRAAHIAGIVHRDLKPANVMLLPDGTVKILDFGLARVESVALTRSRIVAGTVSYMSPEQIQAQPVDERADLWAIGVILYEMVTGRLPFDGDHDMAVAHAIMHTEPEPASSSRSDLGTGTDELIASLLRKPAGGRPASAAELAAQLDAVAATTPAQALRARRPVSPRRRRLPRLRASMAVLVIVISAGATARLLRRPNAGADGLPRMVAVIPFATDGDTAVRYLAVGVSDAIATALSGLHSVVVSSATSTAGYREDDRPLPLIAKELAMAAVVHGHVTRLGDSVRLDLRFADSTAGNEIRTRSYQRPAAEVLQLQRDALRDLTSALRLDVTNEERARLGRPPTNSTQAYDLYLRGRDAELGVVPGASGTEQHNALRLAQSFYSRARDLDPAFALARARLALTYHTILDFSAQTDVLLDQASVEAETALRLDPDLPEAHEAMAWYWLARRQDTGSAATELELAIRGVPNSPQYHLSLGVLYRRQGRWEEALVELDRAMRVEPRNPAPAVEAATTYSRLRRYEQAVKAWDRALTLAPENALFKIIRGHVFIRWNGSPDSLAAALRTIPHTVESDGPITFSRFEVARLHRRWDEALTALDEALTESSGDDLFFRPRSLLRAEVYDALGERQRALADYEAARVLLVDSVSSRPDDERMRIALGLSYAGLGRRQEAVAEARRAMDLVPFSQNSVRSTATIGGAIEIFARAGEADAALELIELLLSMPAGREISVPLVRADPTYDPLRSDPRLEEMLQRFSQ